LAAAGLHVDVASRQARQDQRLLAVDEMAAIELGADGNGQAQAPHRRLRGRPIRHGPDKIAAKSEEHFGAPVYHRLHGIDDIVPMRPGRLEPKHFLQLIQELRPGLLVDAHGSVALDVGMAADRANACSGLANIAAHQEQVHCLLHV
jgi:hypothetical protein